MSTSYFDLSNLIIRPIKRTDLHTLEWNGEYIHFRRLFSQAFQEMENGNAVLWMAEYPLVGLIGQIFVQLFSQNTSLADGSTRAYIHGVRVKPQFRNFGIGTRLMQIAEEDLIRRGFREVVLNVGQDNDRARLLYECLGYIIVGIDPGEWAYMDHQGRRQSVVEPAWRMEKKFR
ncbi:MAG: GNAT family N-acetyltransferase [Chloroflexota bacterium]